MDTFIITCPATGLKAQVVTDEDEVAEGTFVPVACPACGGAHWVNPASGRLLGQPEAD